MAFRDLVRRQSNREALPELAAACMHEFSTPDFVNNVEKCPIVEKYHYGPEDAMGEEDCQRATKDQTDVEDEEDSSLRSELHRIFDDEHTSREDTSSVQQSGCRNKEFRFLFLCAMGLWTSDSESTFLQSFFQAHSGENGSLCESNTTVRQSLKNLLSVGKGTNSVSRALAVMILLKVVTYSEYFQRGQHEENYYLTTERQHKLSALLLGKTKTPRILHLLLECLDVVKTHSSFPGKALSGNADRFSDKMVMQTIRQISNGGTGISVDLQVAIFHHEMCVLIRAVIQHLFSIHEVKITDLESSTIGVLRQHCKGWSSLNGSQSESYNRRILTYTLKILNMASVDEAVSGDEVTPLLLSILDDRLSKVRSMAPSVLILKSLWYLVDADMLKWNESEVMPHVFLIFCNLLNRFSDDSCEIEKSKTCLRVLPKITDKLISQIPETAKDAKFKHDSFHSNVKIVMWRLLVILVRIAGNIGIDTTAKLESVSSLCESCLRSFHRSWVNDESCRDKGAGASFSRHCLALARNSLNIIGNYPLSDQQLHAEKIAVAALSATALIHIYHAKARQSNTERKSLLVALIFGTTMFSIESFFSKFLMIGLYRDKLIEEFEVAWRNIRSHNEIPLSACISEMIQNSNVAHTRIESSHEEDPYRAAVVLMKAYRDAEAQIESLKCGNQALEEHSAKELQNYRKKIEQMEGQKEDLENKIDNIWHDYQSTLGTANEYKRKNRQLEHNLNELKNQELIAREEVVHLKNELQQESQEKGRLKQQLREKFKLEKQIRRLLSDTHSASSRQDATEVLSQWFEASQDTPGKPNSQQDCFTIDERAVEKALDSPQESQRTQRHNPAIDLSRRFSHISPVIDRSSASQYVHDYGSRRTRIATPGQQEYSKLSSDVVNPPRRSKRPTLTPKSAMRRPNTPASKRVTITSPQATNSDHSQLWEAFSDFPLDEVVEKEQNLREGKNRGTQNHGEKDRNTKEFMYSPSPVRTPKTRKVNSSVGKARQRSRIRHEPEDGEEEKATLGTARSVRRTRQNEARSTHRNRKVTYYNDDGHDHTHSNAKHFPEPSQEDKENILDDLISDITASTFHGYE